MRTFLFFGLLIISIQFSFSQDFTQIVKGKIVDKVSQSPLPGVNIVLLQDSAAKVIGTVTDMDGYYKLENVPVGRISLQFSFLGYNTITLNNLANKSGKELVLNIEMEEMVLKAEEVTVKAYRDKGKSINKMASVSARTFTVEETQRYAGARNDVSRMATNFAGVSVANDAVNDIVIRGNSPYGLLWRMEGIEIPNPNHFGQVGATGGPVSMLNNNLLSNSDFFTGAFPAEYGNATSGVFDLQLRAGNYEKHEFLGQVGFNGFEFGAEGPIHRKSRSSYLINYRYSTLDAVSKMGMDIGTGTAVPKYQDLSFKFNFPTKKLGTIALFGMGGISSISFIESQRDSTDDSQSMYSEGSFDIYNTAETGVVGLSHKYILNASSYIKTTIGASHINSGLLLDSISDADNSTYLYKDQSLKESKLFASSEYHHKFSGKMNFETGIRAKQIIYNLQDSTFITSENRFFINNDEKDHSFLYQAYAQLKYKFSENFNITPGVYAHYFALNKKYSIEPRLGVEYKINATQRLAAGLGMHSQTLPVYVYFSRVETNPGNYILPNSNLDFMKCMHYVLSYNIQLNENLRFKAETYYQDLYQTVVEESESSFSMINNASFNRMLPEYLTEGGSGNNYGLELTFEQFMKQGFYYLTTVSLFESKYMGSDNIERNTVFNGNYILNFLGGKEFALPVKENAKSKKYLSLDGKLTWAGGQRYTPVDKAESIARGYVMYDWDKAFTKQFDDYFRLDVRAAFRLEGKKATQEWAFDIQNLTNRQNPFILNFNQETGEEEMIYQLGFFPMMQYVILF